MAVQSNAAGWKMSADLVRVEELSAIIDRALLKRDRWDTGPTFVSMNGSQMCLRGVRVNFAQMVKIELRYSGWVVEHYYSPSDYGLKFTLRNR